MTTSVRWWFDPSWRIWHDRQHPPALPWVAEGAPTTSADSLWLLAAIQSFGNLIASGVAGILWTQSARCPAFLFAATGMAIANVAGFTARRHPGETDKSTIPTDSDLPD